MFTLGIGPYQVFTVLDPCSSSTILAGLPAILRDVADRIEATPPDRKVSCRIEGNGGPVGVYVLVDDDEVWQQTMRAHIDDSHG